jgi:hypothetical protein
MDINDIQGLLNQVATINKKNTEILDATGGRFNIFRICGVNHYENTHSSILAEFLNPQGSHSLKNQFLDAFLETIGKSFILKDFDTTNATVHTEYVTDNGRIDILIKDHNKNAIIIENKIYACDQHEQLKRYDSFAKKHFEHYQIYYLTLFGSEASEQSAGNVIYHTISYAETIIQWLDECIALAVRLPLVRETLIQYSNHIKQLTDQDMSNKNEEEITSLLAKFHDLKAIQSIYFSYPKIFNQIAKDYFNPKMEEYAKEKELEYHYENSDEYHINFYLRKKNWKENFYISFEFEKGKGYYYGIFNDKDHLLSAENRKKLREKLQKTFNSNIQEAALWPYYEYIPNLSIETWESDVRDSEKFFEDCKQRIETLLTVIEKLDL